MPSSNLKRKGGGGGGDPGWNPTHVLLHPSQIPHSHYTASARGSTSSGFTEPYQDYEDYASEYDDQHSAPHSAANSRRASLNLSQTRCRSRPTTPPVGLGHGRNDSDYEYGIDLGGGLSSSSSSSSLGGLSMISHERLGRGGLRRIDVNRLQSRRRKSVNIWKLLLRILGGLGLAWVVFGLVRIGASQVRIIYSHWMHIPVELLDLCQDAEWTYRQPTLLTTGPSMETSSINQLHFASTFFEIPAGEPLYLLSQGNFSYGTVEFIPATYESTILQDPDRSENDQGGIKGDREQKIRVEVDAKYRDPSVFDWARVCMIGSESAGDGTQGTGRKPTKASMLNQVGVMVWTPETSVVTPKEYQLHLRIRVHVPPRLASRHGGKRAWLPSIITDLPTFEHLIGDLAPTVDFHKFNARTQKSIQVKSLRAESISLQTVNQTVHGVMESWSSIHVETLNAGLDVNATLTPAPSHLHARYTELFLKTSNAPLTSRVVLHADSRTPAQNVFKVTTRTTNGPLVVVFPPTLSSTHTTRDVDSPYLDSHASDHDPSNARPQSELTSIVSSRTAKNSSTLPEGSDSGGKKDAKSDSTVLVPSGEDFILASSFSPRSTSSWPILRFDGQTTHGPVYVDLPPTFEGYYALRTSDRHQPRLVIKKATGGFHNVTENIDGADLVREVTDEVLEGGEVMKGTIRLVPAGSRESESSGKESTDIGISPEDEGQSPTPSVPSDKGKLEDGTFSIPVAWANLWTTSHRVELWV